MRDQYAMTHRNKPGSGKRAKKNKYCFMAGKTKIIVSSPGLNQILLWFLFDIMRRKQDILRFKDTHEGHHQWLKAMFTSHSPVLCIVDIF